MTENQELGTRERIMEHARNIFLEKGFQAATVREICSRANANVAAINYHFKDKNGLLLAILSVMMDEGLKQFPMDLGLGDNPTPEERLHAFILSFLYRLSRCGTTPKSEAEGRLITEALSANSPILEPFVHQHIIALRNVILDIVRQNLGPHAREEDVSLGARAVIGQCQYYFNGRPIDDAMNSPKIQEIFEQPGGIEGLASQLTTFTLGGIRALRKTTQTP